MASRDGPGCCNCTVWPLQRSASKQSPPGGLPLTQRLSHSQTEINKNDFRSVNLHDIIISVLLTLTVIFKYHDYLVYCDTPKSIHDDIQVLITKALINIGLIWNCLDTKQTWTCQLNSAVKGDLMYNV